jgi:hypothetical protein
MAKPKSKKSSKGKAKKSTAKKKSAPIKAKGGKKAKAGGGAGKAGKKKTKSAAKPSKNKGKKGALRQPRTGKGATAKAGHAHAKKPEARKPASQRPPEQHEHGTNGDQQELDAGWATAADTIVDKVAPVGGERKLEHEESRPSFSGGKSFGGEHEDSFGGNGEHTASDDEDEEIPHSVGGEDEDDELHSTEDEEE